MSKKLQLVKRIVTLLIVGVLVVLLVRWCSRWLSGDKDDMQIENTPIRVEMIRNIAEIATVSYRDEVVVDSVEYYRNEDDLLSGAISKLIQDPKHGIRADGIKRRMTLVVRGEIRYGFDLTKHPVKIGETDSLITVRLPQPTIVDLQVTPSSTDIFQENGEWKDYEVAQLRNIARKKLVDNSKAMNLEDKSRQNMIRIIRQLIRSSRPVQVEFE